MIKEESSTIKKTAAGVLLLVSLYDHFKAREAVADFNKITNSSTFKIVTVPVFCTLSITEEEETGELYNPGQMSSS